MADGWWLMAEASEAMRAIGFTVKSGWAAAVVVEQTKDSVRVVDATRVDLCDPDTPESKQPYHDGFATMRKPGRVLTGLVESVRRCGERSVSSALSSARNRDAELVGAGVVVGSLIDPSTIGNEHIRIHAMEGQLFREVVAAAAAKRGVACTIWRERDLMAVAVKQLRRSDAALKRHVTAAGSTIEGPWRAEQKSATLAAWLVLAGPR
jgi:hypothetical protein